MPETSPAYRQTRGVSYLYMAAAFVIVIAGLRAAESIVNPLLLAIFLAIISAPAYFKLITKGVSEWLALLTVIGVLAVAMVAVTFFVTKSIAGLSSQQEHYRERLEEGRRQLRFTVDRWTPAWVKAAAKSSESDQKATKDSEVAGETDDTAKASNVVTANQQSSGKSTLTEYLTEQFDPGIVIDWVQKVALSLSSLLSNVVLILLAVIFILLEAGEFSRKMSQAFSQSEDASDRAKQIVASVQHYVVIKTWVSLATGLLIALWLNAWNVSHAPLWGLLAFLFNYIPNVGSFLAAIPALVVAWLELTWWPTVACAVGIVMVNGVVGNFLEPRLMGQSLGLSPLVVFCSMIFWGWVLGPVGMLLSVPLTMTARIAMDSFEDTKWLSTLMGT